METIAIVNVKGGVGKTSTAISLGHALAMRDRRVLIVDFDPQGNATQALGVDATQLPTVYHLLKNIVRPPEAVIERCGMSLLPADLALADAEIMVGNAPGREHRLQVILEGLDNKYDYCLIDSPPTMGFFTLNAMAAANYLLVPVETQYLPLRGVEIVLEVLRSVRKYLHPDLKVLGILATKYDTRRSLDQVVLDRLRATYPDTIFKTVIRASADIAGSSAAGQPVTLFAPSSHGAEDYRQLAEEVLDRTGGLYE